MGRPLPSWAKLLRETLDNWLWLLTSTEKLVANIVESMKWSDSKQLTAYTAQLGKDYNISGKRNYWEVLLNDGFRINTASILILGNNIRLR